MLKSELTHIRNGVVDNGILPPEQSFLADSGIRGFWGKVRASGITEASWSSPGQVSLSLLLVKVSTFLVSIQELLSK